MPDAALALELDRALAGEDAGAEAHELAALLAAAAEPARLEVAEAEIESALARVPSARRARTRSSRRVALAFAAAFAVAAAAALVLRTPADGVEAKAAAALDRTYFVIESVRPARPGLFRPTVVSGTVDPRRGLGRWTVTSGGDVLAETRVRGDRVTRWDAKSNTITVAGSCRAFATGCADVLDPVELYRRSLGNGSTETRRTGDGWRLTLRANPHVEQVVTIDGKTFLPTRIEWRDDGKPISFVRVTTLDRNVQTDDQNFELAPHPGARVRQISSSGRVVRRVSQRAIAAPRGALWLGPEYEGLPARAYAVRFTTGSATRIDYGPLTVWTYEDVVPPEVVAATTGPVKTIVLPGGRVARVFFANGGVAAEVAVGKTVGAVVTAAEGKADVVRAAEAFRRVP